MAIDVGNTNVKCKAWDESGVVFIKSVPLADLDRIAIFSSGFSPDFVVLASVNTVEIGARIRGLFPFAAFQSIESARSCMGVTNGYEDPEKLGVDRWVAIIEAFHDSGNNPCCVFDLGTALTLDVVTERGQHLGGYITPGFKLMQQALLNATQRVRYLPQNSFGVGYGENTVEAVERGIFSMVLAWVLFEIRNFKKQFPEGIIYITGGDAQEILPLLECAVVYRDSLVLDGLKRIASS